MEFPRDVSPPTPSARTKSIFDPIHGIISLGRAPLDLIADPAFQRLWGIRQTGFAHLVFPGANHTRLEHSLGVYWVARTMAEKLGLDRDRSALVASGGLLHDLGHPPFSHTLEPSMRETLGYGHEAVSRRLITGSDAPVVLPGVRIESQIPRILERHGISPPAVARLIDPQRATGSRPLLRALLHGAIDADRIDYLQRDAHYTGVAHGTIDSVRLLDTVRGRGGRLIFAEKGRSAVEGFLVGRALMYSSVYYHKTVRAAEVMAQAAVERLPGYPDEAANLFRFTDVELLVVLRGANGLSRVLTERLLTRRLYKRSYGWKEVTGSRRSRWLSLIRRPEERRRLEDAIGAQVRSPPGSVLLDLAGLEPREPHGGDWADVGVEEGRRVVYPFRPPSLWQSLIRRPPTFWTVSVYTDPRWREPVEKYLERDPSVLP